MLHQDRLHAAVITRNYCCQRVSRIRNVHYIRSQNTACSVQHVQLFVARVFGVGFAFGSLRGRALDAVLFCRKGVSHNTDLTRNTTIVVKGLCLESGFQKVSSLTRAELT